MVLLVGCSAPSLLIKPVFDAERFDESVVRAGSSAKIVVISVDGLIANARAPGLLSAGENKLDVFTQQLERAAKDSAVKAVVLRINSPGGTVTGSDAMYEIARRFREESDKPVVASIQEVGASGGYYVSLAADEIVSQPTSVVGSIGVIFNTFEFSGAMAMLGVRAEAIKSGELKDMASPFHELSPREREVMQTLVNEYFDRFRSLVAARRGLDSERLAAVTDGRVFSGQQGLNVGLVDRLGTLDDAIDRAAELAGVKSPRVVMYHRPYGPRGSIYASANAIDAEARTLRIELPGVSDFMPSGFYYLWRP